MSTLLRLATAGSVDVGETLLGRVMDALGEAAVAVGALRRARALHRRAARGKRCGCP